MNKHIKRLMLLAGAIASLNSAAAGFTKRNGTLPRKYDCLVRLSKELTENEPGDSLKVRAIFEWMTSNIAYDCQRYHKRGSKRFKAGTKIEHARQVQKWEKELAVRALIRKKGVCEDYALLFRELCLNAGIEAQVITGYGYTALRTLNPNTSHLPSDHAWNAVLINDKLYLLDVTWASGYCDKGVKTFTRSLNEEFYLSTPEEFIRHHFPKSEFWQLSKRPLTVKEFVLQAGKGRD